MAVHWKRNSKNRSTSWLLTSLSLQDLPGILPMLSFLLKFISVTCNQKNIISHLLPLVHFVCFIWSHLFSNHPAKNFQHFLLPNDKITSTNIPIFTLWNFCRLSNVDLGTRIACHHFHTLPPILPKSLLKMVMEMAVNIILMICLASNARAANYEMQKLVHVFLPHEAFVCL